MFRQARSTVVNLQEVPGRARRRRGRFHLRGGRALLHQRTFPAARPPDLNPRRTRPSTKIALREAAQVRKHRAQLALSDSRTSRPAWRPTVRPRCWAAAVAQLVRAAVEVVVGGVLGPQHRQRAGHLAGAPHRPSRSGGRPAMVGAIAVAFAGEGTEVRAVKVVTLLRAGASVVSVRSAAPGPTGPSGRPGCGSAGRACRSRRG